jgi:hypothetical protein
MHTETAPSPSPLYRSEAFAEDLEPEDTPAPQPLTGVLPALLALLPAMVALASGAAAVVAKAS